MARDKHVACTEDGRDRVGPLRLGGEIVDMVQHVQLLCHQRCQRQACGGILVELLDGRRVLLQRGRRNRFAQVNLEAIQPLVAERTQEAADGHRAEFQPVGNGRCSLVWQFAHMV